MGNPIEDQRLGPQDLVPGRRLDLLPHRERDLGQLRHVGRRIHDAKHAREAAGARLIVGDAGELLDHHRLEPTRGGIVGGGKADRAGADDNDVDVCVGWAESLPAPLQFGDRLFGDRLIGHRFSPF